MENNHTLDIAQPTEVLLTLVPEPILHYILEYLTPSALVDFMCTCKQCNEWGQHFIGIKTLKILKQIKLTMPSALNTTPQGSNSDFYEALRLLQESEIKTLYRRSYHTKNSPYTPDGNYRKHNTLFLRDHLNVIENKFEAQINALQRSKSNQPLMQRTQTLLKNEALLDQINLNFINRPRVFIKKLIETRVNINANFELTRWPKSQLNCSNILRIELVSCFLYQVPEALLQAVNLIKINLSFNYIKCIPDQIGQVEKLKELYLHNNLLTELPDALFMLTQLETLHLGNHFKKDYGINFNYFRNLPLVISKLSALTMLNVQDVGLAVVPNWINDMKHLKNVNAKLNPITELPTVRDRLRLE